MRNALLIPLLGLFWTPGLAFARHHNNDSKTSPEQGCPKMCSYAKKSCMDECQGKAVKGAQGQMPAPKGAKACQTECDQQMSRCASSCLALAKGHPPGSGNPPPKRPPEAEQDFVPPDPGRIGPAVGGGDGSCDNCKENH